MLSLLRHLRRKVLRSKFLSMKAVAPITKTVDFLRETRVELDKVVWPSRIQTIRLTVMVIIVTIVVGFFLGGLDYLLTQLTQWLLSR